MAGTWSHVNAVTIQRRKNGPHLALSALFLIQQADCSFCALHWGEGCGARVHSSLLIQNAELLRNASSIFTSICIWSRGMDHSQGTPNTRVASKGWNKGLALPYVFSFLGKENGLFHFQGIQARGKGNKTKGLNPAEVTTALCQYGTIRVKLCPTLTSFCQEKFWQADGSHQRVHPPRSSTASTQHIGAICICQAVVQALPRLSEVDYLCQQKGGLCHQREAWSVSTRSSAGKALHHEASLLPEKEQYGAA